MPKYPVPDNAGYKEDLFRVNAANRGLEGAVVFLTPTDGSREPLEDLPDRPANSGDVEHRIDQFDYRFEPHVTAIQAGDSVTFSSTDPGNHNVRATVQNPDNLFNINTTPTYQYSRRFLPEPEGVPIRLSCDIHAWMHAWLYVFEHPWFAVSDADGRFRVPDVPAGRYRIRVTQPDGQLEAAGTVRVPKGRAVQIEVAFQEKHLGTREILTLEAAN